MYRLFFILVLSGSIGAIAQDGVRRIDSPGCPQIEKFFPLTPELDTTRNGEVIKTYLNEEGAQLSMIIRARYETGVLNGSIEVFRYDGHRYCKGEYANNKKTGRWIYYHPNSVMAEEGFYDPEQDISFKAVDCLIEPFMDQSYLLYGLDSITSKEDIDCDVIPYLNIGFNREIGRTGIWTRYDRKGEVLVDIEYVNGTITRKIPYNPRKSSFAEQVEFIAFYQGQNQWFRIEKTEINTEMPNNFIYASYENIYGMQTVFPKHFQKEFYPLAYRPVLTKIDSTLINGKYYQLYYYHVKNCYEDGFQCQHAHMESHNTIIFSPDYGKMVEVLGFSFHPRINILSSEWMKEEDRPTYDQLLNYVIQGNEELLIDQYKHIKAYFKVE